MRPLTGSEAAQLSGRLKVELWGLDLAAKSARRWVVRQARLYMDLGLLDLADVLEGLQIGEEEWAVREFEEDEAAARGRAFGRSQDAERARVREMARQLALREVKGGDDG